MHTERKPELLVPVTDGFKHLEEMYNGKYIHIITVLFLQSLPLVLLTKINIECKTIFYTCPFFFFKKKKRVQALTRLRPPVSFFLPLSLSLLLISTTCLDHPISLLHFSDRQTRNPHFLSSLHLRLNKPGSNNTRKIYIHTR